MSAVSMPVSRKRKRVSPVRVVLYLFIILTALVWLIPKKLGDILVFKKVLAATGGAFTPHGARICVTLPCPEA